MTRQIVRLCYMDYGYFTSYYFLAPDGVTEEEFGEVCDGLIADATRELIRLRGNVPEDNPEWEPSQIHWENIVEVMATKFLPPLGYEPVELPAKNYSGGAINYHQDDPDGILERAGVLDEAVAASKRADLEISRMRIR